MLKIFRRLIVIFLVTGITLAIITYLFMQQASFGKLPSGERLERIKESPQYKDDAFQNITLTLMKPEDVTYWQMFREVLFKQHPLRTPPAPIPTVKRDLKIRDSLREPAVTWFGHSTVLIQIDGKNILIDPVFSARTSPVQYAGTKAFPGTMPYTIEDLPEIDLVLLSHDHYDHLDYNSILKLKNKAKMFVMPLGVGSHLEYWGVDTSKMKELDWWDSANPLPGLEIIATPARHFSGRGFTRNKTLWTSYVIRSAKYNFFFNGDSGYEEHFKLIGEKYGPFDLAFIETGQYSPYWPNIHMMPEESVQAAIDVKAKVLMPIHWGKFALSIHAWDDPIRRTAAKAETEDLNLTTPLIGELVFVDSLYPNRHWWLEGDFAEKKVIATR